MSENASISDGLTIVKLGGSYALSPRLPHIVAGLAAARHPVVIVPGGGPFADAVRAAQAKMGLDDGAAHRMALLAMCQFGEALASLHPRFVPANGFAHIRKVLGTNAIAIWMPWPMSDGLEALPASWDLTSDSLAAWLTTELGATRLLLLKSADPPNTTVTAADLANSGIVDPAFPAYLQRGPFSVWWLGPSSIAHLARMIDGDGEYGNRIQTGMA